MAKIYDAGRFKPRDSIGYLFGSVRKALIASIEQELAALDISAAQVGVVLHLFEEGSSTAADLCKAMSYDPGGMTRLLDRLERKNFLRRLRADEDRRVVRIELTRAGKALYPRIVEGLVNAFNRRFRGFTRIEMRQLESLLQRMLENA